jgi:hypothetical protein
VPEPKDYIAWTPSKELLAWVKSRQRLQDNVTFTKGETTDPFVQEAMRVFSGLRPADQLVVDGLGTPLSLQDAAAGIKGIYQRLLDQAWADAKARGDTLPPAAQKDIPPVVEGQQ